LHLIKITKIEPEKQVKFKIHVDLFAKNERIKAKGGIPPADEDLFSDKNQTSREEDSEDNDYKNKEDVSI